MESLAVLDWRRFDEFSAQAAVWAGNPDQIAHKYVAMPLIIPRPVWTSYANKLTKDEYKNQSVEFMQILYQNDSVQHADKFKLTPYDYLFQREKRRIPIKQWRNTPPDSWRRQLEDEWLDMKPDGEALLMLSFPPSFDYRIKCQIIGSLQQTSTEYLLRDWATEMQKSMLSHLLGQYQVFEPRARARVAVETRKTVDRLTEQLSQQLNISPGVHSSGVWNQVGTTQKKTKASENRRGPLARTLEQLALVLEGAETLISEATFYGVIYETAVDATRAMQETKEFLRLLTKIVADSEYGDEELAPNSPAGRSIGVNSPHSPYSLSWANEQNRNRYRNRNRNDTNGPEAPGVPEPTLGEPRFVSPGSNLNLIAAQHAQLGQTMQNTDPNCYFPQVEAIAKTKAESSQKKRKM